MDTRMGRLVVCLFEPNDREDLENRGSCKDRVVGPSFTYCARHELAFFAEFHELSPPRDIVMSEKDAGQLLQQWEDRVWQEQTKSPAAV